jgi:hypothetical protein
MFKSLALAILLVASPIWAPAQPVTHLGVPAANLVAVELSTRSDLSTGKVTTDVGILENGVWTWDFGAKGFEVPKGRTLIITDAQAWVFHEPGTGTPASLELMLEHPAAGYSGSMALFTFADIPANAMGVKRQTWTSGFMVPQGMSVKIWVQQFYPLSLMSMARIVVHGYYL